MELYEALWSVYLQNDTVCLSVAFGSLLRHTVWFETTASESFKSHSKETLQLCLTKSSHHDEQPWRKKTTATVSPYFPAASPEAQSESPMNNSPTLQFRLWKRTNFPNPNHHSFQWSRSDVAIWYESYIFIYIKSIQIIHILYIYMNIIKYTSIMNQLIFILFMILIKQITISTPFSAEMTPSACWKPFTSSSETKDSKDSPRLADRRAVKQKMKIYDENNWEYHAMNNMYIEGWLTWKISLSNWIAEYMGYDYILKYHWIYWYP